MDEATQSLVYLCSWTGCMPLTGLRTRGWRWWSRCNGVWGSSRESLWLWCSVSWFSARYQLMRGRLTAMMVRFLPSRLTPCNKNGLQNLLWSILLLLGCCISYKRKSTCVLDLSSQTVATPSFPNMSVQGVLTSLEDHGGFLLLIFSQTDIGSCIYTGGDFLQRELLSASQ